jgi:uncharacterized membrane protein YkvA (DUF1232 family)
VITLLSDALSQAATEDALAAELSGLDPGLSEPAARALADVLAPFLRTLPDALAWAVAAARDPHGGRALAFATGSVLHYVIDDDDLLPESTAPLVGLVDDAYLTHAYVAAVHRAFPGLTTPLGYEPPDQRAFDVAAALLPAGVAESLVRTCTSTTEIARALFAAGSQDAGIDDPLVQLDLRLADAAQLVG